MLQECSCRFFALHPGASPVSDPEPLVNTCVAPGCSDLKKALHERFEAAFPEEMERYEQLRQSPADPTIS